MTLDQLLIESQRELIVAQSERIQLLGNLLIECADDLEVELRARWCSEPDGSCHPALQSKFDRDMDVVNRARAASAMSAGTAETTQIGSGLQPASAVGEAETPKGGSHA